MLLYKEQTDRQTEGERGCRVCKQVMQMENGKSKSLTAQEMQREKKRKKVETRWRAKRFPDTTHTAVTLSDGSWADTHVMLADRENNNCLPPLYQELHCSDCGGEPDSSSRWALLAGLMITLNHCDAVSPSTRWKSRIQIGKSAHCAVKQSSGFNFPLYFTLERPFSFDQSPSREPILRLSGCFLQTGQVWCILDETA